MDRWIDGWFWSEAGVAGTGVLDICGYENE